MNKNLNNGENFRDIENSSNYEVSSLGRVRNKRTNKIILHVLRGGYHRVNCDQNYKRKFLSVHRIVAIAFIANPNNYKCVDHINGKKDDNTVSNLRWCDTQMNCQNREKIIKQTSSKYKGVCFHKASKKWYSRIMINGKSKSLGLFDTAKQAAQKYNAEARKLFGDFAKYNIISDSDGSDSDDSDSDDE